MNRRFLVLLAGTALGSATMFGSTTTVSLGSSPFPTGAIGPYVANVGGATDFVYCDDDTHTVYPNETWTATVTTLSQLVALGNANIANNSTVMWRNLPAAVTLYEEASWLVYQFQSNTSDASGLQNAIWDLFLQKAGTGSVTDPSTDSYWLKQANANYTTLTASQMAGTVILTPVAGTQKPGNYGTPQEFITTTPEPASYALIGIGVMLAGLIRRRGSKTR